MMKESFKNNMIEAKEKLCKIVKRDILTFDRKAYVCSNTG